MGMKRALLRFIGAPGFKEKVSKGVVFRGNTKKKAHKRGGALRDLIYVRRQSTKNGPERDRW